MSQAIWRSLVLALSAKLASKVLPLASMYLAAASHAQLISCRYSLLIIIQSDVLRLKKIAMSVVKKPLAIAIFYAIVIALFAMIA